MSSTNSTNSAVGSQPRALASSMLEGTTLTSPTGLVRKVGAADTGAFLLPDNPPNTSTSDSVPEYTINGIKYIGYGLHPEPSTVGTFFNEVGKNQDHFISRYLRVTRLPNGLHGGDDHEIELNLVQQQMKLYQVFATCVPLHTSNGIHLRFDNIRDAGEAKQLLQARNFGLDYVDSYDFAIAKSQDTGAANEFEGQVKLIVLVEPEDPANKTPADFNMNDLVWLGTGIETAMTVFGTVCTYAHVKTENGILCFTYRLEFHSVEAANRAAASIKRDACWNVSSDENWRWVIIDAAGWNGPRAPDSPHRHQPQVDDQGRLVGFRPLPQTNLNALTRHPADLHNRVRRERILDGADIRTTIMLRNIPNKLDWMSLKTILDQICFGTYDFVYLRIDFKSAHNVGYAFINFSEVHGMIALLDHLEYRDWPGYRSNKSAEISYATIQGKEALIAKFRNSSVMQETPFCRPRLFLGYREADKAGVARKTGTEQAFPPPDNLSKLQRSMDSARSIGLFSPAAPHGGTSQAFSNGHGNGSAFHNTHGHAQVNTGGFGGPAYSHANIHGQGPQGFASPYDRGTPRDMMHAANMNVHHAPDSTFIRAQFEQWFAATYGASPNVFPAVPVSNRPERPIVAGPFGDPARPRFPVVQFPPGIIGGSAGGASGAASFINPQDQLLDQITNQFGSLGTSQDARAGHMQNEFKPSVVRGPPGPFKFH